MQVFEAVRTVLTVRRFQDKPIPPDAAQAPFAVVVCTEARPRRLRRSWFPLVALSAPLC